MATRRVVVDDTDAGIQYTPVGSWFPAIGQNEGLGNLGPPFQNTLHRLGIGNGSLSYTFIGTAVSVIGTNSGNTASELSLECFVDNISIGSKPFGFPENNQVFCEADSLSDAQHTITLRATVSGKQPLWFDRILYSPSSSVNLDSSLIMVDAGDPAVTYSPGWQDMMDNRRENGGKMTLQQGADATIDFSGTSLKWFSFIPSDQPHESTSATYSVDGGIPTTFTLSGLVSSRDGPTELYNQLFFEASGLSPGEHRIEVVHGGNIATTPLSLTYVVIQNAPASSGSTTSTSSSSTPSPNSSGPAGTNSSSAEHKRVSTGAIVGGVVGGVVMLVAVIPFLLLLRRRRKRNGLDHDFNWRRLRT